MTLFKSKLSNLSICSGFNIMQMMTGAIQPDRYSTILCNTVMLVTCSVADPHLNQADPESGSGSRIIGQCGY
jgi:hypothetical protein